MILLLTKNGLQQAFAIKFVGGRWMRGHQGMHKSLYIQYVRKTKQLPPLSSWTLFQKLDLSSTGHVSYVFTNFDKKYIPSKLEKQCKKGVYFSFNFG